jgi:hypothetical protein
MGEKSTGWGRFLRRRLREKATKGNEWQLSDEFSIFSKRGNFK